VDAVYEATGERIPKRSAELDSHKFLRSFALPDLLTSENVPVFSTK
jgi:hypothetical protein